MTTEQPYLTAPEPPDPEVYRLTDEQREALGLAPRPADPEDPRFVEVEI